MTPIKTQRRLRPIPAKSAVCRAMLRWLPNLTARQIAARRERLGGVVTVELP